MKTDNFDVFHAEKYLNDEGDSGVRRDDIASILNHIENDRWSASTALRHDDILKLRQHVKEIEGWAKAILDVLEDYSEAPSKVSTLNDSKSPNRRRA